jgi:hypothetical protein
MQIWFPSDWNFMLRCSFYDIYDPKNRELPLRFRRLSTSCDADVEVLKDYLRIYPSSERSEDQRREFREFMDRTVTDDLKKKFLKSFIQVFLGYHGLKEIIVVDYVANCN